MKSIKYIICCCVPLALLSGIASAQDFAKGANSFDTPIGKLDFVNGYPTDATSKQLYDRMDFQRAVQAYLWAIPYVSFQSFHEEFQRHGAGELNSLPIYENRLLPSTGVYTGNGTTIYSLNTFMLKPGEPVVLEVPAGGVLGMINNAWQQPLEDIGLPGPDRGKGGSYLILPPAFDGKVPDGYHVVQSDSYKIYWLIRGFTGGKGDEFAVNKLKEIRLYRLSEKANPPAMNAINMSPRGAQFGYPTTDGYFEMLARGLQSEYPREEDKNMLGILAELGIEPGKPFQPDARIRKILDQAEQVGNAMAVNISFNSRNPEKKVWPDREYAYVFLGGVSSFEKDTHHMIDSRINFAHQALSTAKSMTLKIVGAGSQYFAAQTDADGDYLDGSKHYKLHLSKDVPAKNFWSLVVYDVGSRSMIINDQGRVQIDTFDKFKRNADGTVDLYVGPTPPKDLESNWIQTNPGTGFFVYFRLYGPEEEFFDGTWKLDDLEKIK
jgi:hypothetical protein